MISLTVFLCLMAEVTFNDVMKSWKYYLINECLARLSVAKRRPAINKGFLWTREEWKTMT